MIGAALAPGGLGMNRRGFLAASIGTASSAALGGATAQPHSSADRPEPLGALMLRVRCTRTVAA
jgi:hypothetical protein